VAVPALAFAVVGISWLLGTHIYGAALLVAYGRDRAGLSPAAKRLLLFAGVYVLAALTLLTATTLVMDSAVAARFDAIYETIGDQLWLPKETYRASMMNISLAVALAPCALLFGIMATGALLQWHKTTRSHRRRAVLSVLCVVALSAVAYGWTQTAGWKPPASWRIVSDSAVEALRAAKDDPGLILTNDLRYQPGHHLPLMNPWAPQLFGQQFYASNFMYFSFAYPDVLERFHEHQWFWSTAAGERHRAFVAEKNIKYLLIRRDMPFPEELPKAPWVRTVLQNTDYYLLYVNDRPEGIN
jgi:hypothetical protein